MSDDYKPQTGPGKILNDSPQSPKDVGDTYRPDSEKHIAKTLKGALSQGNQATYSRAKR
jgi:hypothetical protein